jgi:hypothetical protein
MSALPAWVRSRWVVVPGLMTAVLIGWNLYVAAHDSGLVEGLVVDAAGKPVAGAVVVLFDRGFVTHTERARTIADAAGRFRFTGNANHSLQLEAEAPGLGKSDRRVVRLWFRSQDVRLALPLKLAGSRP